MVGTNGVDALFAQFVSLAWVQVTKACGNHCGVDCFNKGMCNHKDNSSYGILEGTEGLMRCSILACPHKDATYTLAKKMQARETTKGLDLFKKRESHLRVVTAAN